MGKKFNGECAPWDRIVILGKNDYQLKINGRDARILHEAGYWKWTLEAQQFLAQALLDLANE